MKIKYFAGGYRLNTLKHLIKNSNFFITEVYVADIEKNKKEYKDFCLKNNINVVEVNKYTLIEKFSYLNEDILLSVGFRYIIPKEVYSLFKFAINIHPSLLPKYKGAYSGYAVIENGEKETGLTAHFLNEKTDSGDIINQEKIAITICDNIDSVTNKIKRAEPEFVLNTLLMIKEKKYKITKQKEIENEIIYNKRRKPEDSKIDPNKPLISLLNKIRSCSSEFPAYFEVEGKKLIVKIECESEDKEKK